jgi:hypothetical protein
MATSLNHLLISTYSGTPNGALLSIARWSLFTLAALLAMMAQEMAMLPRGVRTTAVRLAERLCRDDQPVNTRAGISGI